MSNTPLTCRGERRRRAVRAGRLNGLDYLDVSDDQLTLTVYFLGKAPDIQAGNVRIEGGRRVRDLRITGLTLCVQEDPDRDDCMHLTVDRPGDFSTYRLCLVEMDAEGRPTGRPFPGFDPRYACLEFSFKAGCPGDLDCGSAVRCPPEPRVEPPIDYLAKDYASFRQLILDRLSLVMPGWRERHVPDLGIALVELLAYTGDHLSYFQDAVATEAYLHTARRRISVRRHARLVDYAMHDGANARAWVFVGTSADVDLDPRDVYFLTRTPGLPEGLVTRDDLRRVPAGSYAVFEPLVEDPARPLALVRAHNRITIYSWGNDECCLPRGATRATLRDRVVSGKRVLRLRAGDFLLFEERIGPRTGHPGDADPKHRHAVRLTRVEPGVDPLGDRPIVEVEWAAADALPFPLCLASRSLPPECRWHGNVSVARGNILLVDHGRTVEGEPLGEVPAGETVASCREECRPPEVRRLPGRFRPVLREGPLTFAEPLPAAAPAALLIGQDPRRAVPAVLRLGPAGGAGGWAPRRDLLASGPGDRHFVAEVDEAGRAHLRFGDGEAGRAPAAGTAFAATYRVGLGPAGNVGAGAIAAVALRQTSLPGTSLRPRNPLPARGGTAPEPLADVRLLAPHAFRREQRRAVTADDYARLVERGFRGRVQKAAATLRWTGSWHEVLVAVDAVGGEAGDELLAEIALYLHRYRRIGHDLAVRRAVPVALAIALRVCVRPGFLQAHVKEALLGLFSSRVLPDGRRGLFHPDELTFGQGIALSRLVAAAQAVPGVESVRVEHFERLGEGADGEVERGFLPLGPLEVARFDNDLRNPENGVLRLELRGGR